MGLLYVLVSRCCGSIGSRVIDLFNQNTHRHVLHDGDVHAAADERAGDQRRGHHQREVAQRV